MSVDPLGSIDSGEDMVVQSEVGAPNGVASLGGDGKVPASQLSPGVGYLLNSIEGVDATLIADTNLFTVPAGKQVVVTSMVIRLTTISGSGTVPKISCGVNSPSYDNIIINQSVSGLTAVENQFTFVVSGLSKIAQAADIIKARVGNASTFTDYIVGIDLIGYIV